MKALRSENAVAKIAANSPNIIGHPAEPVTSITRPVPVKNVEDYSCPEQLAAAARICPSITTLQINVIS